MYAASGMRNTIAIATVIVQAAAIRATAGPRPSFGASSCARKEKNGVLRSRKSRRLKRDVILMRSFLRVHDHVAKEVATVRTARKPPIGGIGKSVRFAQNFSPCPTAPVSTDGVRDARRQSTKRIRNMAAGNFDHECRDDDGVLQRGRARPAWSRGQGRARHSLRFDRDYAC